MIDDHDHVTFMCPRCADGWCQGYKGPGLCPHGDRGPRNKGDLVGNLHVIDNIDHESTTNLTNVPHFTLTLAFFNHLT